MRRGGEEKGREVEEGRGGEGSRREWRESFDGVDVYLFSCWSGGVRVCLEEVGRRNKVSLDRESDVGSP